MTDSALQSVRDVACPECGPDRKSPANRTRKVRREWRHANGFVSWYCARCGSRGGDGKASALPEPTESRVRHASEITDDQKRRREIARWLWDRRLPPEGTPVEVYLRSRGIACELPGTIGYLPVRGEYPHAMITAFGLASEVTCGRYEIAPDQVIGVHLTRLSPDGTRKADSDRAKLMLGTSGGVPLMLSPPNNALGLSVTEGIEDALSVAAATGLGAWAAGSAGRMPGIADRVPDYIESVLIFADDDPAGLAGAEELREKLLGRIPEVRLSVLLQEVSHGV